MKLKIIGMHCTSCAMTIDGDIEDTLIGVASASTSYVRAECEVVFDENKVHPNDVIRTIKTSGYIAEIAEFS